MIAWKSASDKRAVASGFKPHGLAFDQQGATYNDLSAGRIAKIDAAGRSGTFATGVDNAIGMAFGPSGDLYAAQRKLGSVLRIKADGTTSVT